MECDISNHTIYIYSFYSNFHRRKEKSEKTSVETKKYALEKRELNPLSKSLFIKSYLHLPVIKEISLVAAGRKFCGELFVMDFHGSYIIIFKIRYISKFLSTFGTIRPFRYTKNEDRTVPIVVFQWPMPITLKRHVCIAVTAEDEYCVNDINVDISNFRNNG